MRIVVALAALLLVACGPKPQPPAPEPPAPSPIATQDTLPPASPTASLIEASCVRMGSIPMQQCSCWSRYVTAGISADIAAAYGIQNVAKRADAMTALKPDQMKAFVAASEAAEAECAKRSNQKVGFAKP